MPTSYIHAARRAQRVEEKTTEYVGHTVLGEEISFIWPPHWHEEIWTSFSSTWDNRNCQRNLQRLSRKDNSLTPLFIKSWRKSSSKIQMVSGCSSWVAWAKHVLKLMVNNGHDDFCCTEEATIPLTYSRGSWIIQPCLMESNQTTLAQNWHCFIWWNTPLYRVKETFHCLSTGQKKRRVWFICVWHSF